MKNYFGTLRLKNRQLYDKEITEKKKKEANPDNQIKTEKRKTW